MASPSAQTESLMTEPPSRSVHEGTVESSAQPSPAATHAVKSANGGARTSEVLVLSEGLEDTYKLTINQDSTGKVTEKREPAPRPTASPSSLSPLGHSTDYDHNACTFGEPRGHVPHTSPDNDARIPIGYSSSPPSRLASPYPTALFVAQPFPLAFSSLPQSTKGASLRPPKGKKGKGKKPPPMPLSPYRVPPVCEDALDSQGKRLQPDLRWTVPVLPHPYGGDQSAVYPYPALVPVAEGGPGGQLKWHSAAPTLGHLGNQGLPLPSVFQATAASSMVNGGLGPRVEGVSSKTTSQAARRAAGRGRGGGRSVSSKSKAKGRDRGRGLDGADKRKAATALPPINGDIIPAGVRVYEDWRTGAIHVHHHYYVKKPKPGTTSSTVTKAQQPPEQPPATIDQPTSTNEPTTVSQPEQRAGCTAPMKETDKRRSQPMHARPKELSRVHPPPRSHSTQAPSAKKSLPATSVDPTPPEASARFDDSGTQTDLLGMTLDQIFSFGAEIARGSPPRSMSPDALPSLFPPLSPSPSAPSVGGRPCTSSEAQAFLPKIGRGQETEAAATAAAPPGEGDKGAAKTDGHAAVPPAEAAAADEAKSVQFQKKVGGDVEGEEATLTESISSKSKKLQRKGTGMPSMALRSALHEIEDEDEDEDDEAMEGGPQEHESDDAEEEEEETPPRKKGLQRKGTGMPAKTLRDALMDVEDDECGAAQEERPVNVVTKATILPKPTKTVPAGEKKMQLVGKGRRRSMVKVDDGHGEETSPSASVRKPAPKERPGAVSAGDRPDDRRVNWDREAEENQGDLQSSRGKRIMARRPTGLPSTQLRQALQDLEDEDEGEYEGGPAPDEQPEDSSPQHEARDEEGGGSPGDPNRKVKFKGPTGDAQESSGRGPTLQRKPTGMPATALRQALLDMDDDEDDQEQHASSPDPATDPADPDLKRSTESAALAPRVETGWDEQVAEEEGGTPSKGPQAAEQEEAGWSRWTREEPEGTEGELPPSLPAHETSQEAAEPSPPPRDEDAAGKRKKSSILFADRPEPKAELLSSKQDGDLHALKALNQSLRESMKLNPTLAASDKFQDLKRISRDMAKELPVSDAGFSSDEQPEGEESTPYQPTPSRPPPAPRNILHLYGEDTPKEDETGPTSQDTTAPKPQGETVQQPQVADDSVSERQEGTTAAAEEAAQDSSAADDQRHNGVPKGDERAAAAEQQGGDTSGAAEDARAPEREEDKEEEENGLMSLEAPVPDESQANGTKEGDKERGDLDDIEEFDWKAEVEKGLPTTQWLTARAYAEFLGLDTRGADLQLYRLFRPIFASDLPAPWNARRDSQQLVFFYHPGLVTTQWRHPLEEFYMELVSLYKAHRRTSASEGAEPAAPQTAEGGGTDTDNKPREALKFDELRLRAAIENIITDLTDAGQLVKQYGQWKGPYVEKKAPLTDKRGTFVPSEGEGEGEAPSSPTDRPAQPRKRRKYFAAYKQSEGSKTFPKARWDDPVETTAKELTLKLTMLLHLWRAALPGYAFPIDPPHIYRTAHQAAQSALIHQSSKRPTSVAAAPHDTESVRRASHERRERCH
ncbi:unnamed protein product [Vitrella brassicaformis CCMP3155]|uniref:WW domain-containing protein n=4 Tax=Vitrella brassicaformis TaxID=1169539 RepID=A0A0G4EE55_VITBC|nr:unnamed protein product [Vitrella brassicaformis CCMP3155]|eukprot:CEL93838.1 unnamed protein product [Vitrella brassicaformis CCMP3155]